MSREYSIVRPRFWIGDTGKEMRKMGHQVQVVAFYLITCPTANMLGLYYLGMPTLCHETGSPFEGASKALRSLQEAKFAYYDGPSECVFVPNMAREQIGERLKRKDNRHVAVLRELHQLRKAPFFNDFLKIYRDAFELQDVEPVANLRSPLEAPSKGLPKPLRSQDQDQDQDQEQEQGDARGPVSARAKRTTATRIAADFDLTPERAAYATAQRIDPQRTMLNFRDYWTAASGAKARKCDWDATWRMWCRNDADRRSANGNGQAKPNDEAAWAEARAAAKDIGFRDPHPGDTVTSYARQVKAAKDAAPSVPLSERRGLAGISQLADKLRVAK